MSVRNSKKHQPIKVRETEIRATDVPPPAGTTTRPLVLVVEDNFEMNRFIAQSLVREYDVISAFDGQEGLEMALRFQPALIVSDIMMPGVSGVQMITELRKRPEMLETPILLLSAKADEDLKLQLLEESVQDFITKPFSERDLRVRIRNLIMVKQSREIIREGERKERQAVEESNRALQLRFAQLSELFEQTPSFMAMLRGPDHVFEFVNPACYKLLGQRDLIGKPVAEALPEIKDQGFIEMLHQVFVTGEPFIGSGLPALLQRQATTAPEERYVNFVFQPLLDAEKNIVGVFVEGHDVTEEVLAKKQLLQNEERLEQQVQERTKALKLSNEDLQQFAHVASHDLKEPVRKIKIFSNLLKDNYQEILPEKANNFLQKILGATDRIYAMIEGVLNHSILTSDSEDHLTEMVDLNEVFASIQTDLEVLIEEKKATIHIGQLPSLDGVSVLLYQLFYNLLKNALKFSKATEPPLIYVQCAEVDLDGKPFAEIVLSDNGIGFHQKHAEEIFTTFTRLNSKDKYEGTGLGLALCKKIVERHGGFITAKGEEDKGAAFTVLLPLFQTPS